MPPDFVVIGNVTRDLVAGEERTGGTAAYTAAVAAGLGLSVAIVTKAPKGFPTGPAHERIQVYRLPAESPTVFEHHWYGARRDQFVRSHAGAIEPDLVPSELREAPVVLFGPVAWEVGPELLGMFPRALRGATLQGWLRLAAPDGHLEPLDPHQWNAERVFPLLDAAFLSEEDLALPAAATETLLDAWAQQVLVLAVTRGERGASIAIGGEWYEIGVMPARQVDGTGAGDTFAAAFLIRYHESADAGEAARFASAASSFVVEARGLAGVPGRDAVLARMAANPDVQLRRRSRH